jgi:hypothetical protein
MLKTPDNRKSDIQTSRKTERNPPDDISDAKDSGGSFGNTEESQELEGMVGEVMDRLSV